jgi:NAD+ kinase
MQVVVYSKILHDKDLSHVQLLFDVLQREDINIYVFEPYYRQIKDKIMLRRDVGIFDSYLDFKTHQFDFVITLGGDGTILDAVTVVRDFNVPILGINLGRLGFLAGINKNRIEEAIVSLRKGIYTIDTRKLLFLESNFPLFGELNFALNDCTILKRDNSSMITIHTFINGAYLNSYWADGLIIATPTGSTGYSLSCGGPIIFPNSSNFVITPVAPHNLNVRPIVIPDNAVVSFEIEGRAENFLCTLDSRFEVITAEHQLAVRRCDFSIRLVQVQEESFLYTLRDKLAWGRDTRN